MEGELMIDIALCAGDVYGGMLVGAHVRGGGLGEKRRKERGGERENAVAE